MAEQNESNCALLLNETDASYVSPSVRPFGAEFQIGLFYFENSCYAAFLLLFAFFKFVHPSRSKYSRIQHRSLLALFITHFGASMLSVVGSWMQSHQLEDGLPCWLFFIAYFAMIPCLVLPLIARLLAFYQNALWTKVVILTAKFDQDVSTQERKGMSSSVSEINMDNNTVHSNGKPACNFFYTFA